EQDAASAREEGDEGRVVHVAPGQPLPAGRVVELVAEDAVALQGQEMREDEQARDRAQRVTALARFSRFTQLLVPPLPRLAARFFPSSALSAPSAPSALRG